MHSDDGEGAVYVNDESDSEITIPYDGESDTSLIPYDEDSGEESEMTIMGDVSTYVTRYGRLVKRKTPIDYEML